MKVSANLESLVNKIKRDFPQHRIQIRNKTVWKGFEQHYSHILDLDDFQDITLEAGKLAYEILTQHPLIDGNKRLYVLLLGTILNIDVEKIYWKLGE